MIPVCGTSLGDQESMNLVEAIRSGWVSQGRFVDQFEHSWAAVCGRKHGVACATGSAALDLAVKLLDLSPGDEVIMPAFTMIACPLSVARNGGVPVFVDCDPGTWTMDPEMVKEKIGPRTKAVMSVHIYGHPVETEPILDLCRNHGLRLIEDAAEAHGAECLVDGKWRMAGNLGDLSCFSFYANKAITCGEGGMVLVDDKSLADRLRSLRTLCPGFGEMKFVHESKGWNYKMNDLEAAVGCAQVDRLPSIVVRKRAIAAEYRKRLGAFLRFQTEEPWARSSCWVTGVVIPDDDRLTNVELLRRLRERGVETRLFFEGMHRQPGFETVEAFPVTEALSRRGLYLPSGPMLTHGDIDVVCDAVAECLP